MFTESYIPYFLGYKRAFSFQNNRKNLDPYYKMDLIRKSKTCVIAKFHRTDLVICSHSREWRSHSREGQTLSYSRINTVRVRF